MDTFSLPRLQARSRREALFHLHGYRQRVAVSGATLTELNDKIHAFLYESALHDDDSPVMKGQTGPLSAGEIQTVILQQKDAWARNAIDDDYFNWIAEDPLAGMFVWFHFLEEGENNNDDDTDINRWTSVYELNIPFPDTPEDRLLALQNIFDTSDVSLKQKIRLCNKLRREWMREKTPLRQQFRFLFREQDINDAGIRAVTEYAGDMLRTSFDYNGYSAAACQLAIPCMYYFSDKEHRELVLHKMRRIYAIKKYQGKNQHKKTVTLLLEPEIRTRLEEIAMIRGVSVHKLISHWVLLHYGQLKK